MELDILKTSVAPGEIVTHRDDETGETIGWLIGEIDGGKIWIGQMTTADLGRAGIYGATAEEPVIWIVKIETDDQLRLRGMVGDYAAAEELAKGTATIIQNQIAGRLQ